MHERDLEIRDLTDDLLACRIDRGSFVKRATALGVSASAVTALLAAGRPPLARGASSRAALKRGGTLQFGMSVEPLPLDPVKLNWGDESQLDLFERLIIRNRKGRYVGQLAQSWAVSPDKRTYTFHLKPGKQFHDGTPLDAKAVKAYFDTIRNPKSGYIWAGVYMDRIASIRTPNARTVVFRLTKPDYNFQFAVANTYSGIPSIAARNKAGADFGTKVVVGSGPFKLKEWVAGDHVSLERNAAYRGSGPNFRNQGPTYLDGIDYRYLAEAEQRSIQLQAGQINAVRDVSYQDVPRLRGAKNLRIVSTPSWDIPMFMFNLEKPLFQDVRVRRAINQAINKKAIVDTVTLGGGKVLNSPIVPHAAEYWPGSEKLYPYDPAAAKRQLADAGWQLNGSSLVKDGKPFQTSLSIWNTSVQKQQAQVIQANLAAVGIKMDIVTTDKAQLNAALTAGRFDMGTIDISWDDALTVAQLFFVSATAPFPNYARYKDPQVDAWFDQARSVTSAGQRKALAQKIQRKLLDDMPAVFLYTPPKLYGIDSKVHDLTPYVWSFYPYKVDSWLE